MRKSKKENVLDEVNDSDLGIVDKSPTRTFKHKTINHSCTMTFPDGISVTIDEGKVKTTEEDVCKELLRQGWYELTPSNKLNKQVKYERFIEWTYRLKNASEERKLNANVPVQISSGVITLEMKENLITTDNHEVSQALQKSGYVLVSSKKELQ
jgi:uncharacterized protein YcgL (UPF0745 family)